MMQEAPEKMESSPTAPDARWPRRRIVTGLVVAGLALTGGWAWWSMRQAPDAPAPSATLPIPATSVAPLVAAPVANALAQISGRLNNLETTLEQLKTIATPANSADSAAVSQLDDAVRAISGGLDAINTTITTLNARLTALEAVQAAQPMGGEAKRMSYALGLRELERALSGSGPFVSELETLAKLLDGAAPDTAITQLRPLAITGVPTRATLATRFDAVAAAIIRADARAGAAPGWAGRIYAYVQSLIMIRPLGEREGLDAPAIAARAQMRLEAGDLNAAVAELGALHGVAAEAAGAWLGDARARLAAEQALTDLTAIFTQLINAAAASAIPPSASTAAGE